MNTIERFLKYISIPTNSDSKSKKTPSTDAQKVMAELLVNELIEIGIDYIDYDQENCYIYACIKGKQELPKVGFLAHMDTCEDAKGDNINPQIIHNYKGNEIEFPNGLKLSPKDYPDLLKHINKSLIVTDGTTLLGADDKAGIAEIMGMLEYYKNTNTNHGDIYVCFTPDEEIGLGLKNFDKTKFPVDFAFTVDGSTVGEISYENFNAATATITINGFNTHTGYAKNKMVNALLIATKINELLPDETPENTEGYEGFYHLDAIEGNTEKATMKYLIRDFDRKNFEYRKLKLRTIISKINQKYPGCASICISNTYFNMKYYLPSNYNINTVLRAAFKLGINSKIVPARGGTDGADLTYMGIPCPNIGTGGHNFHSVYEYIAIEDMLKAQDLLIGIVREYAKEDILKLNKHI
ncbi:MAG: peptidase T [Bacilli bacterium]|nr:peptidase T [Bacilli bacterium]